MRKGIVIGLCLACGACTTGGLFASRSSDLPATADEANEAAGAPIDAQGIAVYLELMRRLIEGDSLTQAETFREVVNDADFAPTTTNRLKLALALAVPGHTGSDAARAEQQLSALLAAPAALLPEERVLAAIQLRDVEQRLILDTTAEQLRRESQEALQTQNTESAARLATALEEIRVLRAELDDARQRLEAITAIEQSIRERDNGSNQP